MSNKLTLDSGYLVCSCGSVNFEQSRIRVPDPDYILKWAYQFDKQQEIPMIDLGEVFLHCLRCGRMIRQRDIKNDIPYERKDNNV